MATNKDLIATATTLAAALTIEIKTEGLSNKELSDLVSELKTAEAEAEAEAEADGRVFVAKGKAITSMAGILSEGQEVTAGHLAGGEDALEALVKGGHCVTGK